MNSVKEMLISGIDNEVNIVTSIIGHEAVQSTFQRYDAHGTYDLNSYYYNDILYELELIANNN